MWIWSSIWATRSTSQNSVSANSNRWRAWILRTVMLFPQMTHVHACAHTHTHTHNSFLSSCIICRSTEKCTLKQSIKKVTVIIYKCVWESLKFECSLLIKCDSCNLIIFYTLKTIHSDHLRNIHYLLYRYNQAHIPLSKLQPTDRSIDKIQCRTYSTRCTVIGIYNILVHTQCRIYTVQCLKIPIQINGHNIFERYRHVWFLRTLN